MRFSVLRSIVLLGLSATGVTAQVVPDQTLGRDNSVVNNQNIRGLPAQLIRGGSRRNINLFHSLSQFNINAGQAAYFSNPAGVRNILTRVTGGERSQLNGTLGVLGSANLFLMNPQGVVFGRTAELDLQGSFFATSAERFQFSEGADFSATNPQSPSALAVNVPIGLGFGSNPGPLVNSRADLSLSSQQSFTLVGGNIFLRGGRVAAPDGQIALISGTGNQNVNFAQTNDWAFRGLGSYRDIAFSEGAIVDTSGDGGGRVDLLGRNVTLKDASRLFAVNLGEADGRGVAIQASETFEVSGVGVDGGFSALLVRNQGTGKGGDLSVQASQVFLKDGALIGLASAPVVDEESREANLNIGDAGNVRIEAQRIEFSGQDSDGLGAVLEATTSTLGKGGNIEIIADQFTLKDRAVINASTFSPGQGGNVEIAADRLILEDASRISAAAFGSGKSGDLTLRLRTLNVQNGSQLGTGTFGEGDSGDFRVSASESIDIKGTALLPINSQGDIDIVSSGLFASVEPDATGNGGRLSIQTGRLNVAEGGKIATNTLGTGNAGNIDILAKTVDVSGAVVDFGDSRSGITSAVERGGSGQGGNVTVDAERIRLFEGGQISASTLGQGEAGNVRIQSQQIQVQGASEEGLASRIAAMSNSEFEAGSVMISAQTVRVMGDGELSVSSRGNAGNLTIRDADLLLVSNGASLEAETQAGEGGNIQVEAKRVQLQRQGKITTNASGSANGGNINLTSDTLVLFENSAITANALQGQGGNINIETQGIFQSPDSTISAASELGIDGTIDIAVLDLEPQGILIEQSTTFADSNLLVANSCLSQRNGDQGRFVISGNGGTPFSPFDLLPLTYNVLPEEAVAKGELPPTSETRLDGSMEEANQLQVDPQGNVQLVVAGSTLSEAEALICNASESPEQS